MNSDSKTGLTATSGRIPANPSVPCHGCGAKARVISITRGDGWAVEITDKQTGAWVAYCPECDPE